MLGIVYLLLAFAIGAILCGKLFPNLFKLATRTYGGAVVYVPGAMLAWPAFFLVGTLAMTWPVYALACLFRGTGSALGIANAVVCACAVAGILWYFVRRVRMQSFADVTAGLLIGHGLREQPDGLDTDGYRFPKEHIYLALTGLLCVVLMWHTFYYKDGLLKVGLTVFSDFAPHLSMIRSFSYGSNFPTEYSFFAGEGVRYHFMFQFLTGNLEYLGMRIDNAFNVTSAVSMWCVFSLLYVLAVKLTGIKAVGFLSGLLFAFRSSPSFFTFLSGLEKGKVWDSIIHINGFIGYTEHEEWGLWNLNVYANQRHLAFSLSVMLLAIILVLPLFFEQAERVKKQFESTDWMAEGRIPYFLKHSFFKEQGWLRGRKSSDESVEATEDVFPLKTAVALGVMLGAIAFWNGAVLICALVVLFMLAAFSDRRLYLAVMGGIAFLLAQLQSAVFIDGSPIQYGYFFGFLADEKTLGGVLTYVFKLTGVLILLLYAGFVMSKPAHRYVILAFFAPFIMSFYVMLTVDVTVNHKNIMLSIMLVNIFVALVLWRLLSAKGVLVKATAVALIICLTITGVCDFITVMVRNADPYNLTIYPDDPLTLWVKDNTDSDDVFLTSNIYFHPILWGGAMLFNGWPYYAWSAGYDTAGRDRVAAQIYGATDADTLRRLVEDNNIRYICVDDNVRGSDTYIVNEVLIAACFETVYDGVSRDGLQATIYDVGE